jgi:hypothetical protein
LIVTGPPVDQTDLNWQEFSSARFRGRGRHDMQALIAYGAYKRSRAVGKPTAEPVERSENAAEERTAVQAWEDEGGRTA